MTDLTGFIQTKLQLAQMELLQAIGGSRRERNKRKRQTKPPPQIAVPAPPSTSLQADLPASNPIHTEKSEGNRLLEAFRLWL